MNKNNSSQQLSDAWSSDANETASETSSNAEVSSNAEENRNVVLLTGGAGFIGSHTAEKLLARGDKVVVIDEMNDYYDLNQKKGNLEILEKVAERSESEFLFVEGDICDRELISNLFLEHQFTHVCHLAARAGVRPSIEDPFIYVQSNVMGTVSLMEIAAKNGVTNFVYASSSSVYGGSNKEKFAETDLVDAPVSQYAATKKACELFAQTYTHLYPSFNCTGLRFFTVYGPRGRPDMAPFKFIHRILNGIKIDQYGDGSSERDYSYIDDIVNGTILALDKPLGCQVLNLGRGTPVVLKEFIGTIEEACGRKAVINVMPEQPGDVKRTSADTSKAHELLNFQAKVPLKEGIEKTVQWYQEFSKNNQVL